MDNLQLIHHLACELESAATECNWNKVQKTDNHIAQMLSSLQGHPQSESVLQALDSLKQLHYKVYQFCSQQSQNVENKMAQHRQTREGLSAYATFTPDEIK